MIIGETFNNDYGGYEEDSYDYLFKRKTKEERQQKRTERKEKREVKKIQRTENKQLRQDTASGGKRRLPILGNFGLFDKNKKKNTTGTSGVSTNSSAKKEPVDTSEPSTNEEKKIAMAGIGAAALQDKSEGGNTTGNESAAQGNEAEKLEAKELDKNGKPKEAGFSAAVGFTFLGIALLLAGIAVVRGGRSQQPQPLKVAA